MISVLFVLLLCLILMNKSKITQPELKNQIFLELVRRGKLSKQNFCFPQNHHNQTNCLVLFKRNIFILEPTKSEALETASPKRDPSSKRRLAAHEKVLQGPRGAREETTQPYQKTDLHEHLGRRGGLPQVLRCYLYDTINDKRIVKKI